MNPLMVNQHAYNILVSGGIDPKTLEVVPSIEEPPKGWRIPNIYPQTCLRAAIVERQQRIASWLA